MYDARHLVDPCTLPDGGEVILTGLGLWSGRGLLAVAARIGVLDLRDQPEEGDLIVVGTRFTAPSGAQSGRAHGVRRVDGDWRRCWAVWTDGAWRVGGDENGNEAFVAAGEDLDLGSAGFGSPTSGRGGLLGGSVGASAGGMADDHAVGASAYQDRQEVKADSASAGGMADDHAVVVVARGASIHIRELVVSGRRP